VALYGIYGASGCGRGVLPVAREQLGGANDELVFIDDAPGPENVNGHALLDFAAFMARPAESRRVSLAIASGATREKLAKRCADADLAFFDVISDRALIMDDVAWAEGIVLSPFVTLTSNIRIGRHFQANLYSYVEHDCVIGDFVTFAPGAQCNGNVVIEDHVYVGSGAVIRQGKPGEALTIGKGAMIGMGAVVTGDVAPGAVVVGNPARPIGGA
jgi:sugar O-acyltransferase (sialic acid O-acetyltransferase NeuD family)